MSCLSDLVQPVTARSKSVQVSTSKPRPVFPGNLCLPVPPAGNDGICNIFIAGIGGVGISTFQHLTGMARIDGIAGTAAIKPACRRKMVV